MLLYSLMAALPRYSMVPAKGDGGVPQGHCKQRPCRVSSPPRTFSEPQKCNTRPMPAYTIATRNVLSSGCLLSAIWSWRPVVPRDIPAFYPGFMRPALLDFRPAEMNAPADHTPPRALVHTCAINGKACLQVAVDLDKLTLAQS